MFVPRLSSFFFFFFVYCISNPIIHAIFQLIVLLEQLEPPNGTSACPGDRIKLVCNTTFQNESTLTWQAICGECETKSFFGNNPNAFSGTLKLPNGANATWEAETLHHTSPGVNTTITSSLIINASLDLHNVTIACCSEHSPSLCSDSAAIPNEYKGIAVINISKLRLWCSLPNPKFYCTSFKATLPYVNKSFLFPQIYFFNHCVSLAITYFHYSSLYRSIL